MRPSLPIFIAISAVLLSPAGTCLFFRVIGRNKRLGGDLLVGNYDLVADVSCPGRLYAPASYGWCVGVQYNFTESLFASVTASQTRYCPKYQLSGDEYRRGNFFAVNAFWNMKPRMQLGAEFDLGCCKNFNGATRWARCIGLMAQFSF